MANMGSIVKKQSMGRQKIEIKKIQKKSSLEVTFSKRRTGLFKKAGELCVLCGAEAAVIVFSPGKRAFVFGHPSADSVIDRFLQLDTNSHGLVPLGQTHLTEKRQYLEALGRLEAKKAGGGDGINGKGGFWWDMPIGNMGLNELEQFKASLEELRKKVANRVEEMTTMMESGHSNAMIEYAPPPQEYHPSNVLPGHHDLPTHDVGHDFEFGGFVFDDAHCNISHIL